MSSIKQARLPKLPETEQNDQNYEQNEQKKSETQKKDFDKKVQTSNIRIAIGARIPIKLHRDVIKKNHTHFIKTGEIISFNKVINLALEEYLKKIE